MRALVVNPGPNFSVADVARGWAKGLHRIGVDVRTFELDKLLDYFAYAYTDRNGEIVKAHTETEAIQLAAGQIKAACYDWWPDLVLVVSGFFMYPQLVEIMRARHRHVVLLCTESPYEDEAQLQKAAWYDGVLLNDPTNLDAFAEVCEGPALYVPHAYDPDVHHDGRAPHHADVTWIGTCYPSRARFLEQVDWSGLDVSFGGNFKDAPESLLRFVGHDPEECVDNAVTAELYRGSLASFNLYRTETNGQLSDTADGWAMGPREVEMAACGLWFARQSRPESDEVFPMLPTFSDPQELGDLLRWAIANPQARMMGARRAAAAVADRTFSRNARTLLQALGL
ncbi:MAG: glycosyltransferase family protein [Ilumatobacteraceae bacterium]